MSEDGLKRRFERMREADGEERVPGFGVMRARAMAAGVERGRSLGWWALAGGGAVAAVVVVLSVLKADPRLEGLPPLVGEHAGEVEFLQGVASGREWLGGVGSDVLLPEEAIKVL